MAFKRSAVRSRSAPPKPHDRVASEGAFLSLEAAMWSDTQEAEGDGLLNR